MAREIALAFDRRGGHPGRPQAAPVSQAQSARSRERTWSVATRSSSAWAFSGSPGPKLTAGMPSALKRATSVQPYFGRLGADGVHELLREGRVEAGPRALGRVGDGELVLGNIARASSIASATVRFGAKR